MNREKIENHLNNAWIKAAKNGGETHIFWPEEIDPLDSSRIMVDLLQSLYIEHDISKNTDQVISSILNGDVEPWIVSHNNKPVACAALVQQEKGVVELGRAASIERGSGAGQIAMLMAALNKGSNKLVAEVRLADEFMGIPSGEATQRICFGILDLVPHAFFPAFAHGDPRRREMFAFSSEEFHTQNDSPLKTAKAVIANRDTGGSPKKLKIIKELPFRIAVPSTDGINFEDFQVIVRESQAGCTLVPVEATDNNLSTIGTLLRSGFVLTGVDRNFGQEGKPVLLFATVCIGTLIAPTKASKVLPKNTREDIKSVARSFNNIAGRI